MLQHGVFNTEHEGGDSQLGWLDCRLVQQSFFFLLLWRYLPLQLERNADATSHFVRFAPRRSRSVHPVRVTPVRTPPFPTDR